MADTKENEATLSPPAVSPGEEKPRRGGTIRRLMRSLSHSRTAAKDTPPSDASSPSHHTHALEIPNAGNANGKATSPGWHLSSTSPPPDSYFPNPPRSTLRSGEASGRQRDEATRGARATEVSSDEKGSSAPGVGFAPPPPGEYRKKDEGDDENGGWAPPPRRATSTRRPNTRREGGAPVQPGAGSTHGSTAAAYTTGDSEAAILQRARSNTGGGGGRSRSRPRGGAGASTPGDEKEHLLVGDTPVPALPSGGRQGVTLEDKPLTRTTSVRRAASALRRAIDRPYTQPAKQEGERRVLLMVADGSEEIEVFAPFDVLVRAGLNPVIVSLSPEFSPSQSLPYITLSRGAKVIADTTFETLRDEYKHDFDAVVIPGGAKGAERLSQSPELQELVRSFFDQGKLVGMICSGALAAKAAGLEPSLVLTSHPSAKAELEKAFVYSDDRVVVSGPSRNLVTSRGPGTAIEFALKIVELMSGPAKRDEVAAPMMI